jgi:acetylornithine deacetylase
VNRVLEIPPVQLKPMEGLPTTVVAFATDIPSLTAWGEPYLLGPGSIHVAHTDHERIAKAELVQAVGIYVNMVKKLLQ